MKILTICLDFHTLVMLVLWCMSWFVLALICHMIWVWSVDTWLTLVKNIVRLFSGFSVIFMELPKHFWSLVELEHDLLATWIQILLLIWIWEGPLQVMCLLLVIVVWVGGQLCNYLLPNLLLRLNTWLLLKHVNSLFGWKVYMLSFVGMILALTYFLIAKLLYT
jgi:hypothetical protein